MSQPWHAALLVAVLALGGCTGSLAAPNGDQGVAGSGQTVGTGGSVAMGGAGGVGGAVTDDGLPGRALIRRLSNTEYQATVQSLLGDTSPYAESFPSDSVVNGFTNNTDVQDVGPALAEQLLVVAEKIAVKATENTDALLGCPLASGEACVATFVERFGKRAWRRPLDAAEQADLLGVFRAGSAAHGARIGLQLLLEAFLVSPHFLYRVEVGVPTPGQPYATLGSWELASRLSYFLTGTMPDDALFALAEVNGLSTPDSLAAEARRLLTTPAARRQVASFFDGWLNLRAVERLERDAAQFPAWSDALPALLRQETREFSTRVIFEGAGDFKTLLTAPFTYGDPALAVFYGGQAGPATSGIARIELPPAQRAGLFTQASFLATHAKEIQTDPVARGKFMRERVLCQGLTPPPPGLMIAAPEITPGTTARQRFMEHEAEPVCAACHKLIDPIGLAFEHYDALGSWRDQEQGQPIDATGDLTSTDVTGPLNGVVEMSSKLAQSEIAAECFVRNWFRFTFGRGESDSEAPRIATNASHFKAKEGKVLELLVMLTATPDFRFLRHQEMP